MLETPLIIENQCLSDLVIKPTVLQPKLDKPLVSCVPSSIKGGVGVAWVKPNCQADIVGV